MPLRRWFPKTREGHTLRHKRVETFDAGGVPSTLGQARNNNLQFARSSLQEEEEEGVADSSEADRDAMEARGDSRSMSGDFFYHHHVMPRGQLYVPKESSFPFGKREQHR